jgi:hypothetical protein
VKGVRKEHLPSKPCAVCGRPFVWRRKWARVWDEVKYCSDRCRAQRGSAKDPAFAQPLGAGGGAMRAIRSGSSA